MLLFEEHLLKINQFLDKGHAANTCLHEPVRNVLFSDEVQGNYQVESLDEIENYGNQEADLDLREEGIILMEGLIQSAQEEKEKSRKACEMYGKERTELIKMKEEASSEYSKISAANQRLAADIQGLLEYSERLEEERNSLSTQLEDITARIHKANEKARTAKKWCWVPGYGLYVAIDCATDSDVKRLGVLSSQREMMERAYEDNLCRLEEKQHTLELENAEYAEKSNKLIELQIKLDQVNNKITAASLDVSQWDKIQDQYRGIKMMLSLEEISVQEALSRMNFMKIDSELFKNESVLAFEEKSKSEKEGILDEGLITPGGIAYVHRQDRIQLIGEDVIPGVKSIRMEKEKMILYNYVVRVECCCPEQAGRLYFKFEDESGDYYTLNIIRKSIAEHTVRYNSEKPNITKIRWGLHNL